MIRFIENKLLTVHLAGPTIENEEKQHEYYVVSLKQNPKIDICILKFDLIRNHFMHEKWFYNVPYFCSDIENYGIENKFDVLQKLIDSLETEINKLKPLFKEINKN